MKTDNSIKSLSASNWSARMNLLATPLFVFSLGMLALNDFVLKETYHNWLTGKLSDVFGLVAFALFAYVIWPSRRLIVASIVSIGFVYWKSDYSQPLIDFINNFVPFTIGRTVDYTDYLALPGVWLAGIFFMRLRPWPLRNGGVAALAISSLLLFTATTCISSHKITRTAFLSADSARDITPQIEQKLQAFFDDMAVHHGLHCTVCEPLSNGRLYVIDDMHPTNFSLTVNFDAAQSMVYYDVSSWGHTDKYVSSVDRLLADIEQQLEVRFPAVKLQEGAPPKDHTVKVEIKKASDSQVKEEDYDKAFTTINSTVGKYGLKREYFRRSTVFSTGKLYGPDPRDREFVVVVHNADSPLVWINIISRSDQFSDLQRNLAAELERELQAVFGKERISIR